MKGKIGYLVLAGALSVAMAQAGHADNNNVNNGDLFERAGENLLSITSPAVDTPAESDGNTLSININGDRNGGLGQGWPQDFAAIADMQPGLITQAGRGNSITFDVTGTGNLFSASQTGVDNLLSGIISGTGNALSVMQAGTGNTAVFSQVGTGNYLAISQSSW